MFYAVQCVDGAEPRVFDCGVVIDGAAESVMLVDVSRSGRFAQGWAVDQWVKAG